MDSFLTRLLGVAPLDCSIHPFDINVCNDPRPVGLYCCSNPIPLLLLCLAANLLFNSCLTLLVILVDGVSKLG